MLPRLAAEVPSVDIPGKAGMIVRSARFLDLEMPPEFFNSWITPVPHFFVRNHMHEPSTLDAGEWRLGISGEVDKPLSLSLADLEKVELHTVTNTLGVLETVAVFSSRVFWECSGSAALSEPPASPACACVTYCSARK
jgi:hypothetical protein